MERCASLFIRTVPGSNRRCNGGERDVWFTHSLFLSHHERSGASQMFSEFIATAGLLGVVFGAGRLHIGAIALAVGGYISAAYWFTASTSFANPAVTIARALSDTF